jgi:hypothetical protein
VSGWILYRVWIMMTFVHFSSPSYTTMLSREINLKKGYLPVPILPEPFFILFYYCSEWSVLMKLIVTWVGWGRLLRWSLHSEWVNLKWLNSIYSFTTNLWWKPTFIRSFHSSVFSLGSTPPMRNTLYSPFVSCLNPKRRWLVWATHPFIWWERWVESGGLTQCELKWPSFGCLNFVVNE